MEQCAALSTWRHGLLWIAGHPAPTPHCHSPNAILPGPASFILPSRHSMCMVGRGAGELACATTVIEAILEAGQLAHDNCRLLSCACRNSLPVPVVALLAGNHPFVRTPATTGDLPPRPSSGWRLSVPQCRCQVAPCDVLKHAFCPTHFVLVVSLAAPADGGAEAVAEVNTDPGGTAVLLAAAPAIPTAALAAFTPQLPAPTRYSHAPGPLGCAVHALLCRSHVHDTDSMRRGDNAATPSGALKM